MTTDPGAAETRHYHGGVMHDHPGGNLPHNHPDPKRKGGSGGEIAVALGILAVVAGVFAVLAESNNHSACNSGLVQAFAQQQCQAANAVWTIGVIGIVVGIALVIGALIVRSRRLP